MSHSLGPFPSAYSGQTFSRLLNGLNRPVDQHATLASRARISCEEREDFLTPEVSASDAKAVAFLGS